MFITERLIFLQLQKTASSHICRLLTTVLPGRRVGGHERLPDTALADSHYVIGSIRNPWDWYVSLWAFGCGGKGGVYERTSTHTIGGYHLDRHVGKIPGVLLDQVRKPVGEWRRVYEDVENPDLFRRWLRLVLTERRRDVGEAFSFSPLSAYAGLLTYRYVWLFSKDVKALYDPGHLTDLSTLRKFERASNLVDAVIRVESLARDLLDAIEAAGYGLTAEATRTVRSAQRTNPSSRRRDLRFYYDEESAELVRQKEQLIVEKYAYEGPFTGSP